MRSFAERAYAAALRWYPSSFRERFGDEMLELGRARLAGARQAGGVAAELGVLAGLFLDLARTAPAQWSASARRRFDAGQPPGPPRDNMDILIQDLRFGIRSLLRRPAFTAVAALTLGLGIGANTAIFSVVNAVLIRPQPFTDPDQLVYVWGSQGQQGQQGVVYPDYLDWRSRNHTFTEMGGFRGQSVNLTGGDQPDRLYGQFVTASFLRTIGARMSHGRMFTEVETDVPTKAPVAVVSYEAWQSRFGANPKTLGSTIVLNGNAFTVIGIFAPKMPVPFGEPDVMVPIGYYPNAKGLDRGVRGISVVGRMKPGVAVEAAQRDLAAISKQLEQEYPATNAATGADVISYKEQTVGRVRDSLYTILAAVAAVLLIACANVANLQLARGAARGREISVRAAIGADRSRIAQQLLTESVLLSLVGGIAGIAIAKGLKQVLVTLIGPTLPVEPRDISLDLPVLLFALGISLATGLLFGIAPALKASRANLNDMLHSRLGGGLAHVATRNTLVVVQLALSLALLTSAGLITRSLIALQRVNPGFDGTNLLTAQFRLAPVKYDSPEKIMAMFDRAVAELRAIPGVEAAALVRASPLSGNGETNSITIDGKPVVKAGDEPQMQINSITSGYFATMRTPLIAGRDITDADRVGALPVIVVNKAFAEKTWPGESALGKRLKIAGEDWRTVVGVAGDAKHFTLNEHQLLQGYIPHAQRAQIFTSIVVRTRGPASDYVKSVREAIWRVDRDQPIWRFKTMQQDLDGVVVSRKSMVWLTGLFAIVALLVAAVGIYGVLSYTMSQRTQEMGIRIALGADAGNVRRLVIGEGLRLIGVAVVFGLLASVAAARLLTSQLFGIGPHDMVTFSLVTVMLSGVAILACYVPAWRASRVDPMVALRAE